MSRVVAQQRGLTLHLDVAQDGAHIAGSRTHILRSVDNLVSNALKYTPAGGHVHVTVGATAGEVVLSCTDTGVGIPLEEQEAVFTEYARARRARSDGIEGTGLGLPSARRIITAHGGSLTLTSAPRAGSTFTARFPRSSRS